MNFHDVFPSTRVYNVYSSRVGLQNLLLSFCKELQHHMAAKLHTTLEELQKTKKIAHHTPTLAQLEEWIAEAKTLSTTSAEG